MFACQLDYSAVEADTGAIGGSASHEFMVMAGSGESAVVRCPSCGYAANVEKAETRRDPAGEPHPVQDLQEVATPGRKTVEEVARYLKISPKRLVKSLIYETEDGLVAALSRGDREINEIKLANLLQVERVELAAEEKVREITGAPVGFAGPVGLQGIRLVADEGVRHLTNFACGAIARSSWCAPATPWRASWSCAQLPRAAGELHVMLKYNDVGHRRAASSKPLQGCTAHLELGPDRGQPPTSPYGDGRSAMPGGSANSNAAWH